MRVRFRDKKQFEGCWVKDISNGGIFLRTQSPPELFTRITVILELPTGTTVELAGEVVRVVKPEEAKKGTLAGIGVQFTDLTPDKREQLEVYLGRTIPVSTRLPPPPAATAPVAPAPVARPSRSTSPPAPEAMVQALRRVLWLAGDADALAQADYYQLLGVARDARVEEIREACDVLRALLDDTVPPDGVAAGGERLVALTRVLAHVEMTLVDARLRAAYDRTHR